jgi:hypothetical protein
VTRAFVVKAWLGGAGLVAGLVGMAGDRHWLVRVAIVLLAAAFLARFAERQAPGGTADPDSAPSDTA